MIILKTWFRRIRKISMPEVYLSKMQEAKTNMARIPISDRLLFHLHSSLIKLIWRMTCSSRIKDIWKSIWVWGIWIKEWISLFRRRGNCRGKYRMRIWRRTGHLRRKEWGWSNTIKVKNIGLNWRNSFSRIVWLLLTLFWLGRTVLASTKWWRKRKKKLVKRILLWEMKFRKGMIKLWSWRNKWLWIEIRRGCFLRKNVKIVSFCFKKKKKSIFSWRRFQKNCWKIWSKKMKI